MAKQAVEAKLQVKDENSNVVLDEEGKPTWLSTSVEYDFGDTLDDAIALCGREVVHSQYVANAKVGLQAIVRTKLKSGMSQEQIQSIADGWKPGMVVEKTAIDPLVAFSNAFKAGSPEKRAQLLAMLGVEL